MGFTNYIAGLSMGLDVPNPAGDYASKLALTAPWRAAHADPTGYVPRPVPPVRVDEQTGLTCTYRDAIAHYDARVATGEIEFGPEGFADKYPHQAESDASFNEWVRTHVTYPDTELSDQEF